MIIRLGVAGLTQLFQKATMIESAKVGNTDYPTVITNANGIITGLNSVDVTPKMSSITVNVVYNKVNLDLTINHDTITNTYNGSEQPVSPDIISEITHTVVSSNNDVSIQNIAQAIQDANLTSNDYSYTDSQGNVLTGTPTNAGNYRIILNQNGLDKLNKVAGGLTINYDPSKSYVNYTIEKAEASAELEGNNSKQYDGQSVTNVEVTKDGNIKVTTNVPGTTQSAYQLQAGDYDWYSADGSTRLSSAPTNVGNYMIKLNSTGIANIKAHYGNSDNINWTDDAITGSATYGITKAAATISLTPDENKQTSSWTGNEISINPADFVPTITTDNGVTLTVPAGTLTVGDYTVTPSPVAPGTYQVSLTDSGIEKIEKAISTSENYVWNNTGNGVLEIVNAKADYQMSGSGETTYTGSAVELPMDQLKDAISSSNTVSGQDLVIPELDVNDFTWSSSTAPTNVGNYTIKLSETGINKIAAANPNYALTLGTNAFTYKINAAKASATVSGENSRTYNGKAISINDIYNGGTISVKITGLDDQEFTYTLQTGDYTWNVSDPTNVGTYTLTLNSTGIGHLQDLLNDKYGNGNVTIANSQVTGSAKYTIEKANANVTLSGNQDETYTAEEFTNSNIKVSDYKVTLSNGLEYKLVDGDLEFIPNQNPTNVGTYTVQLSDQGKKNIAAVQGKNYEYSFNDTGVGSFNITKATPSALFTGQGEKTYDGTPISGYVPKVTITAPGKNDVTLVAGTDYVWTNDGQTFTTAPSDAGNYTVSLTLDGIGKIKAVNAANLDWSNVIISENARYTITKAQATVNFAQPASQTVEYGKNDFDVNNFKPSISTNNHVTVNVPEGVSLSAQAGDFEFTNANGNTTTTVPTGLGTYTVTLSEAGFKKLQSQTNNYDWINNAKGTYIVTKATDVSVTLIGNQEVIYTGNTFTNSDINVNDYQVTLENGQTYKLVAGDLEFGPSQDPTNAGAYKVQLSAQGKENIAKVDSTHYSYNFDNAGTGNFEIQKATPSIEFKANAEKIFDGTSIALGDYKTQPSVTVTAPSNPTITLEAGDYVWIKDGVTYTTAPSNVGSYTIQLSESGKNKILQNSNNTENLDWANAKISGQGSYIITEANATANLSGNSSKTYDGNPVTTTEVNSKDGTVEVTITIPNSSETVTYKLQDGDYTWNTLNGDAPTDAGDYTFKLSPEALTNLQSAIDGKWGKGNVKITDSDLNGEATFTINKADITISGNSSQTGTYTGNPQVVDPGNFPITLTPEGDGPVPTIPAGTLTSNDFVVKDKDGKTVDPTDVGDYTVYLTPAAIQKLEKLNPNYNWPTTEQNVGTLTIIPAVMDITLSGNGSKVSDGQPAKVELSTLADNLTGNNLNKDGLTLADFSWNTPDGNAPSEVGNYTITLNEKGLKKLQADNSNYTVNVSGEFKYTITAARQKIEYVDGNGNVIKTIENIGTASSNYGDKVDFNVKQNVPKDYKLVDSNVSTQITIENGVTKFLVEPNIVTTTDTKTVTRTIIVENPDGSENKVVQTVTFTRPKYTDPVNGEVTYGEWDKSSGNWNKYSAPEIPGYTSNEVPEESVTPATADKTVTVKYSKNPAIETTDTKTVTRIIIVENPDGSENKVVQTVTFTRPKYTDPVNGEVTYGEWDKSSGNWNKYSAPEIPGYTSNEVPGEVVTPDTADKTVTVKYTKNPAIETTDTKTVTRTIIVEAPDGSENKVVQTVTFTRPKYTDPVNGEVTYGEWDKSSGNWDKYNASEISGYTSNEVPEEVVTPDTEDQTIRIGYSKQQEPETPTIPSQPADKKDSGKVSAVKQQVSTTKISKTNIVNTVQKKVGKQALRNRAQVNKKNDHTLPQTGAYKDMFAIISGALAVGIGLLGLSLDRKKKK